ncbi:MAG: FAD:protein FMN transferase [Deltaproteobacteria bacterium]|nr:FAD:protein FMN transferase [Deltaproteobacteria bacterium]
MSAPIPTRRRWRGGRGTLAGCAALLIASLATAVAAAEFRTGQPVMGTVLQVTIVAADDATARALAATAMAEGRRWDDLLTTWRADGELARLNAQAGRGAQPISAELAAALRRMQALSQETDAVFDPGVGPLVAAWRGPRPPLPPPAASAATRIATALQLDGARATLLAGAALDAGGIGKGMALDAIAARLRCDGVQAALLDFGGSSQLAIGAPPDSPAGWPLVIGGLAPDRALGALTLRDAALSTSRAASGPNPAGPIIDPRSGAPVLTPRLATVRAADATSAEAWSKVVVVLGAAGAERARQHGYEVILDEGPSH